MTFDVFQWSQADWYLAGCALGLGRIFVQLRDSRPLLRAVVLCGAFAVAYYTTSVITASSGGHAAMIAPQYRNPAHWAAMAAVAVSLWRFARPRKHWGKPARVFGWANGRNT